MTINLNPGEKISNKKLCSIFRCGNMGGMRKVNATNSLILISDPFKGLYKDNWDGDILYYTGMGKKGDQSLEFAQNKTLYRSKEGNVTVYLFEVENKALYTYKGIIELCDAPFQEKQKDENRNERNVWIFPIKIKDGSSVINRDDLEYLKKEEEHKARILSMDALRDRVKEYENRTSKNKSKRNIISVEYERNQDIVELAKRRAEGKCDLCGNNAPFKDKNNENYLEVHHIVWLAREGKDSMDNVVALCPNCHKRMHILDNQEDIRELDERILSYTSNAQNTAEANNILATR